MTLLQNGAFTAESAKSAEILNGFVIINLFFATPIFGFKPRFSVSFFAFYISTSLVLIIDSLHNSRNLLVVTVVVTASAVIFAAISD